MALQLNSPYGIIQLIHQRLQREWNYWFMETSTTHAVTAGTAAYALPTYWKCELKDGLRILDAAGNYAAPLTKLRQDEVNYFASPTEQAEPEYYHVWGGMINLMPIPIRATTLYHKYYRFLPAPVNDTDEDDIMIYGADVIVFMAVTELAETLQNADKFQAYSNRAGQSLIVLRQLDQTKKMANIRQRYEDF